MPRSEAFIRVITKTRVKEIRTKVSNFTADQHVTEVLSLKRCKFSRKSYIVFCMVAYHEAVVQKFVE